MSCEYLTGRKNKHTPIILEHHGIKEIMSREDLELVRQHKKKICVKCRHYNCLCQIRRDNLELR